jgi:hypothetical protein
MTEVILTMVAVVQTVDFSLRDQVRSQVNVRGIYNDYVAV